MFIGNVSPCIFKILTRHTQKGAAKSRNCLNPPCEIFHSLYCIQDIILHHLFCLYAQIVHSGVAFRVLYLSLFAACRASPLTLLARQRICRHIVATNVTAVMHPATFEYNYVLHYTKEMQRLMFGEMANTVLRGPHTSMQYSHTSHGIAIHLLLTRYIPELKRQPSLGIPLMMWIRGAEKVP